MLAFGPTTMDKQKPRAVFAPEDYEYIKKALMVYLANYGQSLDDDAARKIANLIHRLNRI